MEDLFGWGFSGGIGEERGRIDGQIKWGFTYCHRISLILTLKYFKIITMTFARLSGKYIYML